VVPGKKKKHTAVRTSVEKRKTKKRRCSNTKEKKKKLGERLMGETTDNVHKEEG